jgi:ribose 5-phosphate isomerase A
MSCGCGVGIGRASVASERPPQPDARAERTAAAVDPIGHPDPGEARSTSASGTTMGFRVSDEIFTAKGFTVSEPKVADPLAEAAVAEVQSGMLVGLGTGRTSSRAVLALAERVKEEGLDIRCVATSHATETVARSQRLNLIDFTLVEKVDILLDGADEIDAQLRMLKGQHGAVLRQRLVAHAAERRLYLADENKLVDHLGKRSALPVVIAMFGLSSVRAHLRDMGLIGVVRRTLDGQLFLSGDGHLVLDCMIGDRDLEKLADELDSVPGVVDHGLFLTEADEVLLGSPDGTVRRLARAEG